MHYAELCRMAHMKLQMAQNAVLKKHIDLSREPFDGYQFAALVPLGIVRLFSNSAAVSLLLDLYKEAGCDSFAGRAASIMMSCTETVFYTMAVYFGAVHIKKTRYTLAGALFSSLVGMAVSIALAGLL